MTFFAAAALSDVIGTISTRLHIATLMSNASTATAASPTGIGMLSTAAATESPATERSVPTQMPFDVLERAWLKAPHCSHFAGHPRVDHRFAISEMPRTWQVGQSVFIMLNVRFWPICDCRRPAPERSSCICYKAAVHARFSGKPARFESSSMKRSRSCGETN